MKIYAHYDTTGAIHSFTIVNAPEGADEMLAPTPGIFVTEVEGLELQSDIPDVEELRKIAESHIVPTPIPRIRLTKKR
jgi:hypothetical protein